MHLVNTNADTFLFDQTKTLREELPKEPEDIDYMLLLKWVS